MLLPCSGCGKELKIPDELAGKRARCPSCQTVVEVPGGSAAAAADSPAPPPQPSSCPMCSEPVAAGAARCARCGEPIDAAGRDPASYAELARLNSKGKYALILSLLSFFCCPLGIFGIISGARTNSKLRALGAPSNGLATAGLVLGIVGVIGNGFFSTIAAIAVPGVLAATRAANERNASATLESFSSVQIEFRGGDLDGNESADYWVADVEGLYALIPPEENQPIALIERSAALADAKSRGRNPPAGVQYAPLSGEARPKSGYRFVAIRAYQLDPSLAVPYDETGNGRNTYRFGFCAYPSAYGRGGRMTFILNEEGTVFKKDTTGEPVDVFPLDPFEEGWIPVRP
jgi:hypothetical protein